MSPGATAAPYLDFREEIAKLDRAQQSRVIGRANLQLVEAGVVKWDDVVTRTRIRPLYEVVSREKLTIGRLEGAGIPRHLAEEAWVKVHTASTRAAKIERTRTVAELKSLGLGEAEIRDRVAAGLAAKVGIRPGPGGKPPTPPTPAPAPRPIAPAPVPVAVKPPTPAPGTPILPGKPIAERLAAYEEGDRIVSDLAAIHAERKAAKETMDRARDAAEAHRDAMTGREADEANRSPAAVAKRAKQKELNRAEREARAAYYTGANVTERVAKTLEVPVAERPAWNSEGADRLAVEGGLRGRALEALARLRRFVRAPDGQVNLHWYMVAADRKQRPHQSQWTTPGPVVTRNGGIHLAESNSTALAAHEIGHALEYQLPGAHDATMAFLSHRAGDEMPRSLAGLYPDDGYEAWEMGRKDKFDRYFDEAAAYYTGKDYPFRTTTEVVSMGIQALFEDAPRFAATDPEFAKFVIGILRGDMR